MGLLVSDSEDEITEEVDVDVDAGIEVSSWVVLVAVNSCVVLRS